MFPAVIGEELRALGHDVASLHDPGFRAYEGAPDNAVFAVSVLYRRVIVTENVADFRRLEAVALAEGKESPGLIFTTDRQFPRGSFPTIGRLVSALDQLLRQSTELQTAVFLRPARSGSR